MDDRWDGSISKPNESNLSRVAGIGVAASLKHRAMTERKQPRTNPWCPGKRSRIRSVAVY
jgi:hypothetical protein